ncbi:MAG: hypothetical protein R2795_03610 [Saprospiraceae bacterium]
MERIYYFLLFLGCTITHVVNAQPAYSAHDTILTYQTIDKAIGINLGWHGNQWTDAQLADLAAGNAEEGVSGLGLNTLRLTLPAYFLENWGYGIELPDFNHYQSLGLKDLTVFLQGPSEAHRLSEMFCDT